MEDFLGFIMIFIVLVLGPLLEQMRRKGQQRRPPDLPQRRPLPHPEPQRLPESRQDESAGQQRAEAAAAEMVPDELWEILTGQPKPKW
jgi:hypothetical protein